MTMLFESRCTLAMTFRVGTKAKTTPPSATVPVRSVTIGSLALCVILRVRLLRTDGGEPCPEVILHVERQRLAEGEAVELVRPRDVEVLVLDVLGIDLAHRRRHRILPGFISMRVPSLMSCAHSLSLGSVILPS